MSTETTAKHDSETDLFTEQGKVTDEVTLDFDDGKMLFVSKHLLTLSSPVFEAMFNNDCKERKEMKVVLTGKSFDDFLEFLMCMHPRIAKSIDDSNVLRIAPLAEEYQVVYVIKSCQAYMKKWIKRDLKKAKNISQPRWYNYVSTVRTALDVLTVAARLGYDDVCMYVSSVLGKYPSGICVSYTGDTLKDQCGWSKNEKAVTLCREMFSRLPCEWKYQILFNRLDGNEQNQFKP